MHTTPNDDSAARALPTLIRFFENLTLADVGRIPLLYAVDARFRDPFSDVRGCTAIQRIFTHMFGRLNAPRFTIIESLTEAERAFLTWDFEFRFNGETRDPPHRIHGGSLLRFDDDGQVADHRDYWDAAALYETLPLLGGPMRWLRRRAAG